MRGCGRFLCAVCAISYGGRLLCPGCIKAGTQKDPGSIRSRVLYPGIALALAALPAVTVVFVWFTIITAPMALCVVVYGWNKPQSLVAPGRKKLILAGVIALAEIVGWVIFFTSLWLRKKHR